MRSGSNHRQPGVGERSTAACSYFLHCVRARKKMCFGSSREWGKGAKQPIFLFFTARARAGQKHALWFHPLFFLVPAGRGKETHSQACCYYQLLRHVFGCKFYFGCTGHCKKCCTRPTFIKELLIFQHKTTEKSQKHKAAFVKSRAAVLHACNKAARLSTNAALFNRCCSTQNNRWASERSQKHKAACVKSRAAVLHACNKAVRLSTKAAFFHRCHSTQKKPRSVPGPIARAQQSRAAFEKGSLISARPTLHVGASEQAPGWRQLR